MVMITVVAAFMITMNFFASAEILETAIAFGAALAGFGAGTLTRRNRSGMTSSPTSAPAPDC